MLSSETLDTLLQFAAQDAPKEMCGLMFSDEQFSPCDNSAADPNRTFEISMEEYQSACCDAGEQPWAIVHSHPGKRAALSPKDCSLMDALQLAKMDWAFIIVGLDPKEVRCWRKVGDLYQLQWGHVPAMLPMTMQALREIRDELKKQPEWFKP